MSMIRFAQFRHRMKADEGQSASQTITITVKAASGRYYHLADHLGNVRATACPGRC
jgi:hypothetical protein